MKNQPWIRSARFDLAWFHLPTLLVLVIVFTLPVSLVESDELSPWLWLFFIAGIDVSHVYSTLFRTYFHPDQIDRRKQLFILVPLICFIVGVFLYSLDSLVFWRVLAYLAVFHFVRQQYGFLRIYSRKEVLSKVNSAIDKIVIYSATLFPIIYWHLSGDRVFKWFVENDFISFSTNFDSIISVLHFIYFAIISFWIFFTIKSSINSKFFNIPKFLWIVSTLLSWYLGIVYFNSDLVFTMLNVVAHGIPYMALVWHYNKKENPDFKFDLFIMPYSMNKRSSLLVFILIIVVLGISEEALWDAILWHDHPMFFGFFHINLNWMKSKEVQSILIPLLALPQMVHYVLDGFIWRVNNKEHSLYLKK